MAEPHTPASEPPFAFLELENRLDEMTRVSPWVARQTAGADLSDEDRFRLDLVVTELASNIIQYAFPAEERHVFRLGLRHGHGVVVVRTEDEGRPFDPFDGEARALPETLMEAEPGGLGLHLVREYIDARHHERTNGQNVTTVTFRHDAGERTGFLRPPQDDPLAPERLRQHSLFQDVPVDALRELLEEMTPLRLEPGEVLIEPNQENHNLYLLVAGRLSVHLVSADADGGFAILPGECIGEMSVIENRLTSAWVVAREESTLLVLSESFFWERYLPQPGAVRSMLRILVNRTRKNNEVIVKGLEERLRLEHLERELAAAGKIQANTLPSRSPLFPKHPQVDVSALMQPAKEVGGDFYDAIALSPDHVAIAIGDVSGKGMPAALFMVRILTLLRMHLLDSPIEAVMPTVNREACENNDEMMFATMLCGVLDVRTGRLRYVSGGHNPPFVARAGGAFELLPVPGGMLVGVNETAAYEVAETVLAPGDTLVLYTDGVTEAENPTQAQFEEERALEALNAAAGADAAGLVQGLREAVESFADGEPPSDDLTVLALRYHGP